MQANISKVVICPHKDLTQLEDFKFRCIYNLKKAKIKLYDMKNSKLESEIVEILYNYFNSDRTSKHLLHCLHLIDFMILFPCYYNAIEKYLAQFYYSIFRWLFQNCDTSAVQEAKNIRKYWLGKIDYNIYISIKKVIELTFDVDLEIVNPDSVNNLKTYYQNVLKLTQEQLECHLPQSKSIKPIVKNQEGHKKPSKKEIRKKHEEDMRKMEEMNIGFRYREYVKAQKERIRKERKKSKMKPKRQETLQEKLSKQISQAQIAQLNKKCQENTVIQRFQEGLPCKRRRQRTFQKEMPQVATKKRFLQGPPSPTKLNIKAAPSKSPTKSHSKTKHKQPTK